MPAFVQSRSALTVGAGSSTALAFNSNVTAGNLILIVTGWDNATAESVTSMADTFLTTYARLSTFEAFWDVSAAAGVGGAWWGVVPSSGADTVTVTLPGSRANHWVAITEISGVDSSSPIDKTTKTGPIHGTAGADVMSSTADTTTSDGDLIFGFICNTNGATVPTHGTNFTLRESQPPSIWTEDRVQAAQGSVAATWTTTTNVQDWLIGMIAVNGPLAIQPQILLPHSVSSALRT